MKLMFLSLKRREDYQTNPNTLEGSIGIKNENGSSVTIELSPAAMAKIIACCSLEVSQKAAMLQTAVDSAIANAVGEQQLTITNENILKMDQKGDENVIPF